SRQVPAGIAARGVAGVGGGWARFFGLLPFAFGPVAPPLPAFRGGGGARTPRLRARGLFSPPPLLYMGYVGFSVAFAFAIAALLSGRLDSAFTRFARPWTLAAWVFLTLGIVLGSAWAYYELG
ncbi:cytochrome c biogenesis protein CcsA, partial [Salmonella enterica]|uniref:cytochrome c biogenesis protein CcsA n=1 Tax=Salmonella enterica TaxID=28901 RepID=UPI0006467EC2